MTIFAGTGGFAYLTGCFYSIEGALCGVSFSVGAVLWVGLG